MRRTTSSLRIAGLLVLATLGQATAANTILINGAVTMPAAIDSASLGGSTVSAGGNSYGGSSVYGLISGAGFQSPSQINGNPNGNLLDYLLVRTASGQSVVLSEGEIDPGFGAASDIIANSMNGSAIAPQLIVSGDVNGGIGGRSLGDITSITVLTASAGPAAITGGPSTQFTVTGAVPAPATYTSLAGQPQTTETVSYSGRGSPTVATYTGTQILTLLTNSGLTTDPQTILNGYVVATGSDGYAVVYSLGEIDPAYFANPAGEPLVAAVSGANGAFRTTAPGDIKGGRYASNLENLNVLFAATSVPEPASWMTMLSGLGLVGATMRRRSKKANFAVR